MIEALTEEQVEPFQHHPVAASIGQDFLNACIGLMATIENVILTELSSIQA